MLWVGHRWKQAKETSQGEEGQRPWGAGRTSVLKHFWKIRLLVGCLLIIFIFRTSIMKWRKTSHFFA